MFCFVERPSCDSNKSPIVLECSSACTFSDVRSDAIRGAYELFSYGILFKMLPMNRNIPDPIRQFFRQPINMQILEICSRHLLHPLSELQRTTDHGPGTTCL